MTITHVHTIAVTVEDQDRALRFYSDVLGMQVRLDSPLDADFRWIEVAPPGATTTIALLHPDPDAGTSPGIDTGVRLAVEDAAAEHERLRAAGASVGDLLEWGDVPPMFTADDPDGNRLYFVQVPTNVE